MDERTSTSEPGPNRKPVPLNLSCEIGGEGARLTATLNFNGLGLVATSEEAENNLLKHLQTYLQGFSTTIRSVLLTYLHGIATQQAADAEDFARVVYDTLADINNVSATIGKRVATGGPFRPRVVAGSKDPRPWFGRPEGRNGSRPRIVP